MLIIQYFVTLRSFGKFKNLMVEIYIFRGFRDEIFDTITIHGFDLFKIDIHYLKYLSIAIGILKK